MELGLDNGAWFGVRGSGFAICGLRFAVGVGVWVGVRPPSRAPRFEKLAEAAVPIWVHCSSEPLFHH